jgi:hypothetical protein
MASAQSSNASQIIKRVHEDIFNNLNPPSQNNEQL